MHNSCQGFLEVLEENFSLKREWCLRLQWFTSNANKSVFVSIKIKSTLFHELHYHTDSSLTKSNNVTKGIFISVNSYKSLHYYDNIIIDDDLYLTKVTCVLD